jgi:hypothetical protein
MVTHLVQVTLIKSEEDEFDSLTKLLLFRQFLRFEELMSNDGDAVRTCTDLLRVSQVRGPKKAFIFSDGFGKLAAPSLCGAEGGCTGTTGLQLAQALKAAEDQDVEIRGV